MTEKKKRQEKDQLWIFSWIRLKPKIITKTPTTAICGQYTNICCNNLMTIFYVHQLNAIHNDVS